MSLVAKVKLTDEILTDHRLTCAEKLVFWTLLMHFHNTRTGRCHPSLGQQIEATGLHRSAVVRSLSTLRDLGHIDYAPNKGGRQKRNTYTFPALETVASCDSLPEETVASCDHKQSPHATRSYPVNIPSERRAAWRPSDDAIDTLERRGYDWSQRQDITQAFLKCANGDVRNLDSRFAAFIRRERRDPNNLDQFGRLIEILD